MLFALLLALSQPDIFVVILDDIGNDRLQVYDEHVLPDAEMPVTPNIDRIAADGMRFTRFYSTPTCSPTRAQLFSGLYAAHNGVGEAYASGDSFVPSYTPLAEMLCLAGYETTLVGKFHCLPVDPLHLNLLGPNQRGWKDFFGNSTTGNCPDYYQWTRLINGNLAPVPYYKPTDLMMGSRAGWQFKAGSPRFHVHALQNAHRPLHDPPASLVSHRTGTGDVFSTWVTMIELADYVVGQLYDLVGPDDYFVLLSDNGSIKPAATFSDWPEAKGSMKEPGINTALIVVGPGISPGSVSGELIAAYDIAPTLLDLAKVCALPWTGKASLTCSAEVRRKTANTSCSTCSMGSTIGAWRPATGGRSCETTAGKMIREVNDGALTEELYNLNTAPAGGDGDAVLDPVVFLEMRDALDLWIAGLLTSLQLLAE